MRDQDIMLESVRQDGQRWHAELTFRGKRYALAFEPDRRGRLVAIGRSPFNLTIEGDEVGRLLERRRRGEWLALPCRVEPGPDHPRLPSAREPGWDMPPLGEVWLDGAEKVGADRWVARLRLDGQVDVYEMKIHTGPVTEELRGPTNRSFQTYVYDLTGLLLRMNDGERFALPFQLRPRWPTPPDPPALP